MHCDEYLSLISGHLDGANSETEERRLQEHLKTCAACRERLSQMEQNDALMKASMAKPPADLTERIMDRIRKEPQRTSSQKKRWIPIAVSGVAAAALLGLVFWGNLPILNPSKDAATAVADKGSEQASLTAAVAEDALENGSCDIVVGSSSGTEAEIQDSIIPEFPAYGGIPVKDTEPTSGRRAGAAHYAPTAPMLIVWNAEDLEALADFTPEAPEEYTPLTANAVPSLYARYQTLIPLNRDFDRLSTDDGFRITVYTVPYETMMAVFHEAAGVYENAIYYPAEFTTPEECSIVLINIE